MTTWLPSQQINVIGNPIDFSKFPLRHSQISSSAVRLISIGALEERKNYALLLRAISHVREKYDINVTIVGTGSELEDLKQLTAKLNLDNVVAFVGYVSYEQLIALIHNADFFISTSNTENFGVAIVEALACGVPVIATRSGGPEEFLEQKMGRLSAVKDEIALSKTIIEAIACRDDFNPSDIRSLVKNKFDFPVIKQQVDVIYQGIYQVI